MTDNVVVHPTTKKLADEDRCPKCRGELDTGWECNDCGFDAYAIVHGHPFDARSSVTLQQRCPDCPARYTNGLCDGANCEFA